MNVFYPLTRKDGFFPANGGMQCQKLSIDIRSAH